MEKMTSNPEESLSSIDQENEYSPPQQQNPISDLDENRKLNVASLEIEPDANSAKVDKAGISKKVPLLLSDTLNASSQLFVIRPLQNLSGDKSNKHEGKARFDNEANFNNLKLNYTGSLASYVKISFFLQVLKVVKPLVVPLLRVII